MGSTNSAAAAVSWMVVLLATALFCSRSYAQDAPDLAKLVQNPIAKVISLPLQNNLTFGVGPDHDPQNVLNIQPVLPLRLNADWNVITRTIIPVVYEPALAPGAGASGGLGDTSLALYFSPARPYRSVIWGVGPAFSFATATRKELGRSHSSTTTSRAAGT